jgi:5'-nucleotidase
MSRTRFYRSVAVMVTAGMFWISGNLGLSPAQGSVPAVQRSTQEVALKAPIHITLLQLNDVYQISPVDKGQRGGFARIATLKKNILAENPNTFMVLAGDTLSPSIGSKLFQGRHIVDLWNQVGLDVATLGNHEFDFGNEVLLHRLQESKFQWVVANVEDKTTGKPFAGLPPYIIKEVDGVKIGFFGLLTPDTAGASHPGPNVVFKDPIYAACETVSKMRQAGVDIIVAITHLPMNEDKRLVWNMRQHVALVMGGHEHTLLQSVAAGTPIFKMGSDARNLGRMDLYIDPETRHLESMDYQVIPVDSTVPEDPGIATTVKGYEDKINAELGQVIGSTSVALDARQQTNRSQETNLGNFVADAYRRRMKTDIALINGGSIRANTTFGPGALTRRDVLTVLPFGDHVVKLAVSGSILKQALENGVSRLGQEEAGRFPQVSGLKYRYDGSKPVGSRVISITVGSQPVIPSKIYTLATTAYVAEGGDDYTSLKQAKLLIDPESGPMDAEVVQDAIIDAKTIAPKVEDRITRLDKPKAGI